VIIRKFSSFADGIADLVLNRSPLESARCKSLTQYLSELVAASFVIEPGYTDAGYLLDYANYYSRCHETYQKTAHRLHFFSTPAEDLKKSFQSVMTAQWSPRHAWAMNGPQLPGRSWVNLGPIRARGSSCTRAATGK
jgi:hypothetical protein